MVKRLIYLLVFVLFTQVNISYGKNVNFSQAILPLDPHEYNRLLKLYARAKKAGSQNHELSIALNTMHKAHRLFVKQKLARAESEYLQFEMPVVYKSKGTKHVTAFIKPG